MYIKQKGICPVYILKINSNGEKQIILLMIPKKKNKRKCKTKKEKENWHYHAVKRLSALLRGITLKYDGDFYCMNYLHSFRTEN